MEKSVKLAMKRAKKLEKDNPEFLLQLGYAFIRGKETEVNEEKALEYFDMAANLGNAEAMVQSGLIWLNAYKAPAFAEVKFKKAIELKNEEAKKYLDEAVASRKEQQGTEANSQQEVQPFIKFAMKKVKKEEKKNAEFLLQLGYAFLNGEGTPVNKFKANKYFDKAASLGNVEGLIQTGLLWWKFFNIQYYAKEYFTKAVNLGSEEAKKYLEAIAEENKAKQEAKQARQEAAAERKEKLDWAKKKYNYALQTGSSLDMETCEILFPTTNPDGTKKIVRDLGWYGENIITRGFKSTILVCPCCRGELKMTDEKEEGRLNKIIGSNRLIHDDVTGDDKFVSEVYEADKKGVTKTQSYECTECGFTFDKIRNTKERKTTERGKDPEDLYKRKYFVYTRTTTIKNVPTKPCSDEVATILRDATETFENSNREEKPLTRQEKRDQERWW